MHTTPNNNMYFVQENVYLFVPHKYRIDGSPQIWDAIEVCGSVKFVHVNLEPITFLTVLLFPSSVLSAWEEITQQRILLVEAI